MASIKPSKKKASKPEIVPVGTEEVGYFYFQKLGSLKSGEGLEVTKYESTKKQGSSAINVIIGGIAKSKNINREDASEYIFGKEVDDVRVFPPDQESVLLEYSEELAELNKLQIPTLEIRNFIATMMLSGFHVSDDFVPGRVAFQVELLEEVGVNDEKIVIEPVAFELPHNTAIKFGNVILKVQGNHEKEVEVLSIEKASGAIAEDTTGFLYNTVERKYILGNEEWTNADTAELPQEMIEAIYEFYLSEAGKEKPSEDGGKQQTPLEEVKALEAEVRQDRKSIGTTSISESKNTKSKIVDLVAG